MGVKIIPSSDKIDLEYPDKKSYVNVIENTNKMKVGSSFTSSFSKEDIEFYNMLIFSDNLRALRYLYDDFKGKIRLIYIDPPYATGRLFNGESLKKSHLTGDDLAYDDRMLGSQYIEFLRSRMIFLRELLAEDGSIYVHIDWKMSHYVRVVMDEIFGPEHFVNEISRIKCNPKGMPRQGYGNYKDNILFYSKGNNFLWNDSREPFTDEEIARLFSKVDGNGRRYTTFPLHANGPVSEGETGKAWRGRLPPKGAHWQYKQKDLDKLDEDGLIIWSKNGNPRRKVYADDAIKRGKKRQDIWDFKDPQYAIYPTEKNLDMLKVIIEASSNPRDIVLDAFCGAGTTLRAAESLGRRWIGIDNSPVAISIVRDWLQKETTLDLQPYVILTDILNLKVTDEILEH